MQHVLLHGGRRPAFFVKTREAGTARTVALAAMRGRDDGRVETLWSVGGVPEGCEPVPAEPSGPEGDGAAELFLIGTDGERVPSCGHIELVSLRGATAAVRWSHEEAAWCVADVPRLGPSWSTTA